MAPDDLPEVQAGDALAAALEAAEVEKAHLTKVATEYQSRIVELEAGLREIESAIPESGDLAQYLVRLRRLARDLLVGRTAGGTTKEARQQAIKYATEKVRTSDSPFTRRAP